MRAIILALPLLSVACVLPAGAANEDHLVIDEMPDIVISEMPANATPKRIIEVDYDLVLVNGVGSADANGQALQCDVVGHTSDGGYTQDYNACCPAGWHPLALSVNNGLLCEED